MDNHNTPHDGWAVVKADCEGAVGSELTQHGGNYTEGHCQSWKWDEHLRLSFSPRIRINNFRLPNLSRLMEFTKEISQYRINRALLCIMWVLRITLLQKENSDLILDAMRCIGRQLLASCVEKHFY